MLVEKFPNPKSRNRKVAAQKDEILGRESESRVVSVPGPEKVPAITLLRHTLASHCALGWWSLGGGKSSQPARTLALQAGEW